MRHDAPHKIALDPNEQQAACFAKASGVARFAWSLALARWEEQIALWREYRCIKPSEAALPKELNALKDSAFPWMRGVTKTHHSKRSGTSARAFDKISLQAVQKLPIIGW
jgi:hypothetical protein